MKKRRLRAKTFTRLPLQNRKLQQEVDVSSGSRSLQDLKRRYIVRNVQTKRKYRTKKEKVLPSHKDTFDSLESLFDVKKRLNVSEIKSYIDCDHNETSSESPSAKSSDHFGLNSFPYSSLRCSSNREPNPFFEQYKSSNFNIIHCANNLDDFPSQLLRKNDNYLKMTDENEIINQQMIDDEDVAAPPSSPENEDESENETEDENYSSEKLTEILEEELQETPKPQERQVVQEPEEPDLAVPQDEPLSSRPSNHEDISSHDMTESEIYNDMNEAYNHCAAIGKDIDQMHQELRELQKKNGLNDSDEEMLISKRENLIEKMGELDKITRKIQNTLGLVDLSSSEFAKVFEAFSQLQPPEINDPIQETEQEIIEKSVAEQQAWEDLVPEEDRLDLPQQEYPEDRLPRLIVCGYTEDEIPKIVVADSERKRNGNEFQCLESITEKLAEALDIQEKLAEENAQLEGGKFKLEEALIEKDDTVDTLQRKVCSLQAEMRMIIKENSELSRQLAALDQRLTNQLSDSPRSEFHASSITSHRPTDKPCRCQHCTQKHQSNTVCVSSRNTKLQDCDSPRLGGGGSRENMCCNFTSSANKNLPKCCQNSNVTPVVEQIGTSTVRSSCPTDLEKKLTNYETNTQQLGQQLNTMESKIHNAKLELANLNQERHQLYMQKKLLACTGPPCPPYPYTSPTPIQTCQPTIQIFKSSTPIVQDNTQESIKQFQMAPGSIPSCAGICTTAPMGGSNCPLQQLRDLREQYARLQEDYKNKLTEVSCLRTDAEKMKQDIRDAKDAKERAENRLIDLEERLKLFDADRSKFVGSKEQLMEQEQTLIVARQRYREAQDELEELRSLIQDQANQLEDYRNKYLQAQEQVEEQRRQIELMEMDNARMNENVTLEIGRIKNQFQERLSELAPIPDILKQTQMKLQESQQMRLVAERNCEDLKRELLNCKDRIGAMTSQSEILRNENAALKVSDLDSLEDRNRELRNENERLKNALTRLEGRQDDYKKHLEDKKHEIAQLSSMLDQVREDSARQVARTKERCETVRRRMQGEITEMEKQLVHCRATAKAAQKDRDEIRQKMQKQITQLNEEFNLAQTRIKSLQGHVNYLKPTNSTYCIGGPGEGFSTLRTAETHQSSYDPCDCNY